MPPERTRRSLGRSFPRGALEVEAYAGGDFRSTVFDFAFQVRDTVGTSCSDGVHDDGGASTNGGTPLDVADPECGRAWLTREGSWAPRSPAVAGDRK